MNKQSELGLPIEYQQYPEYFDIPANARHEDEKNQVIANVLARYAPKTVLDMTCGTGAQVFHLLKLGYEVIGSDLSPPLVEIAKDKAAKQNINVQFVVGDIRYVQQGQFDVVITIDNAIGHLVKEDFAMALGNIYKHLNSGGIYVFDILNLDAMTDEVIEADSKKMTGASIAADGAKIYNVRCSTIDRKRGLLTSNEAITIQKNGEEKQIKNTCSLQIYTMNELRELLSNNGFQVIEQYKIDTYTFHQNDKGYGILTVAQKQ